MYSFIRTCLLWSGLIILGLPVRLYGQLTPHSTTSSCGTTPLSREDALKLNSQAFEALENKRNKNGNATPITYIPIRPHIVRPNSGPGNFSLAHLNKAMALANAQFLENGSNIQFYFAGVSPHYIQSTSLYDAFPYSDLSSIEPYAVPNALNQFYTNGIEGGRWGYATYPFNGVQSTISIIQTQSEFTITNDFLENLGKYAIPHELGHTFNLIHTHGSSNDSDEWVSRGPDANCSTSGDMLCDTPADPWGKSGLNFTYINYCPQYDPNSMVRDPQGAAYNPPMTNIMGYWHNIHTVRCAHHEFTPGQSERMQAALALRQTHTAYTLDYPATNVTPPGNLVARTLNTTPISVSLTWQDNANNEMGYFIERSTSLTDGFVAVGGVAPNATTFIDNGVSPSVQYYYRIRPSNTTTNHLSPVVGASTGYCEPAYTNGCANNNGLSSVTVGGVVLSQNSGCSVGGYGQFTTTTANLTVGQPTSFALTLLDPNRPHGITIWADLNRNLSFDLGEDVYVANGPATGSISGTFVIPAGTAGGPLRLRLLSTYNTMPFAPCGTYEAGEIEDYRAQVVIPITGLTTTDITGWSAQFNWNSLGSGVTYDIQRRTQGESVWNTISGINSNTYTAYNLLVETAYEWQVRPSGTEVYSGPVSFTTPCASPAYLSNSVYETSAYLEWQYTGYQSLTLRWRAVGVPDWITVQPSNSRIYLLTGLTPGTAYEWQVQGYCSGWGSTDFSTLKSFTTTTTTTTCQPPSLQTNVPGINVNSTSASLIWGSLINGDYERRQIQYRPVGSSTWQTIGGIVLDRTFIPGFRGAPGYYITQPYKLTGLTPNTHYEWQVQTQCSPTNSSSYVAGASFTTVCPMLISLSSRPNASEAQLSWSMNYPESGSTVELTYRPAGTTTWTTIDNLTATVYSLTGLAPSSAYEWRVRTHCSSGVLSVYSAPNSFTTVCLPVSQFSIYTYNVTPSSALLRWGIFGYDANTRFEIRWRVRNTPEWTTISNITPVVTDLGTGTYSLTGLTNNTLYEWQIRSVCSPSESTTFVFNNEPNYSYFQTQCIAPYSAYESTRQLNSLILRWSTSGSSVGYEVRYRQTGTTDWTTVSNLMSTSVLITGLTSGTQYEWQVRAQCETGVYSAYSQLATVQTLSCYQATAFVPNSSDIAAILNWNNASNYDSTTRYDIRWRPLGPADWITISNLSGNNAWGGSYSLTGLIPSTSYEWQIRTICSPTERSSFTNSTIFQTKSPCPGMHTVKAGSWSDPTVWSCSRVPLGTDAVQIRHVVTIPSYHDANALRVTFDPNAKLIYQSNARLRLGL